MKNVIEFKTYSEKYNYDIPAVELQNKRKNPFHENGSRKSKSSSTIISDPMNHPINFPEFENFAHTNTANEVTTTLEKVRCDPEIISSAQHEIKSKIIDLGIVIENFFLNTKII